MGNIPDFKLPSNPAIIVRLKEANVSDAIDFSGVAEQMEEVATSLFLDRLQYDKARWSDPKLWTGQDRRFALYWYWLHTEKDHEVALTFDCKVCGEKHTELVDFKCFSDSYQEIKGKPERDFEFHGKSVTVRPLCGADLEAIEAIRLGIEITEQRHGQDSGQARQARTRLGLSEIVLAVRFSDEPKDKGKDFRENTIEQMPLSEFEDFANRVADMQDQMEHGLEGELSDGKLILITPPIPCRSNPQEVGTRLRVPFRLGEYIPRIL